VVVSIGRLGSGPATADYYLERQAGCVADYYTTRPSDAAGGSVTAREPWA
jgi:hypothetical protein